MLKSRRRKRKGKREKRVRKKCVDERETLSYEQEILDNNRQLARLRNRNQELEDEAEIVKERFHQLEEDRSDIIAHLKRNLQEKLEETKELTEQLAALEEKRKEELAVFKKKEGQMELEYRTMKNNLSAEVKLAAGKLSALEDWRLARIDLMQKLENQEREIEDQEKRHREALYEAEKSVVIGKAMMTKEMEERLAALADSLRKAINLRVSEATLRAIQENVALNEEFDKVLQQCRDTEATSREYKEAERILRLQSQLLAEESKISFKKAMERRETVMELANDFHFLMASYGRAESNNRRMAHYKIIAENLAEKKEEMKHNIQSLEKCILKSRNDKEQLLSVVHEKEKELNEIRDILLSAKTCLQDALQLTEVSVECSCSMQLKNQLLNSLWNILGNNSIINVVKHTPSEIEGIKYREIKRCYCSTDPPQTYENENNYVEIGKGEDVQENSRETVLSKNLTKRQPSYVQSDISSNILSPKESSDFQA